MLTKLVPAVAASLALFASQVVPAFACGGLVAPNGAIRLDRATTLVDWHDGIEHYLTSFTYEGDVSNLGWIVPLPAVPIKVEEGGAWTLQRLVRETHPQPRFSFLAAATAADDRAQVLQQVQVEALDITVLKGSGQAVLDWASSNGFDIDGDTHDHILKYAQGSPIFMAAKYNTARAKQRGQLQGDGSPVLITMKVPHPWIPFEVLALDGQQVQADLYLLTEQPVYTTDLDAVIGQSSVGREIPNAPGFKLAFQEPMNDRLFTDLSTDRNMSWVRPTGYLTYLTLSAPDNKVTYDMSVNSAGVIKLAGFGTAPMSIADGRMAAGVPTAPLGTPIVALLLLGVLAGVVWVLRPRAD